MVLLWGVTRLQGFIRGVGIRDSEFRRLGLPGFCGALQWFELQCQSVTYVEVCLPLQGLASRVYAKAQI